MEEKQLDKFIPLRNYILGELQYEEPKKEDLVTSSGIILTADLDEKPKATNRLKVCEVGELLQQADLITSGREVVFNGKGNTISLNGKDYVLTPETNLFGIIEHL